MMIFTDSDIIRSWRINAVPWAKAIEREEIESRKLITNQAIINVILKSKPLDLLDLGCGEGWLARELASKGINIFGIDAVPELIEKFKQTGNVDVAVCAYENLAALKFDKKFDSIVCNFSLIGEEATELAIHFSLNQLKANGRLIIQTLHPLIACGDLAYVDGWRPGSWSGFSEDFKQPAPWYFRTVESWVRLFDRNKFRLLNIYEPLHPRTQKPASIIFECVPEAANS